MEICIDCEFRSPFLHIFLSCSLLTLNNRVISYYPPEKPDRRIITYPERLESKMKKLMAVLMAAALISASAMLASCDNKNNNGKESGSVSTSGTVDSSKTTEGSAPESTSAPAASSADETSAPASSAAA